MQFSKTDHCRKAFFASLLSCFFVVGAYAQQSKALRSSRLEYHWQIAQTDSVPDPVLILKNTGTVALHKDGWKIYFNSIKKPFIKGADTTVFKVEQINGDFFSVAPVQDNFVLKPGKKIPIHLTVPDIRSYTEVPSGFYAVYNDNLQKGHLLKNTTPANNFIEPAIAEATFKKNAQLLPVAGKELPPIFPSPKTYTRNHGSFRITSNTVLVADAAFEKERAFFAKELAALLKPANADSKNAAGTIRLVKGAAPKEGYILKSDQYGVTITASTPAGIFYGIQSLKTMFQPDVWAAKQTAITIPAVAVEDAPLFAHRALLLDVARNFQPKDVVKKLMDVMALYKLNVLHFHVTDDEGWRLEIPGLPELTSIGAVRSHTLDSKRNLPPSYDSGPDASNRFGSGFFSRNDFIELLKYATQRHIKVIPEIESPGHARAAIKAMDFRYDSLLKKGLQREAEEYLLRDINDRSVYRSVQGWNDNVINVALPSTYAFLNKVTSEIVKMFAEAGAPLQTIHMGGDEVPEGVWEKSPVAQKLRATDTTLKSTDDLWKYYYTHVNELLKEKNLYLYGWEEIGLKKDRTSGRKRMVVDTSIAGRNYQVDVWNNIIGTGQEDLAYRLANTGFNVVLANVTNLYFDMAYNKSFNEWGMNWGGFVDIDKPFYFIPYNYYITTIEDEYGRPVSPDVFKGKMTLDTAAKKNIVGLQGALWTETVRKNGILEYLLFPKLLALAERGWAPAPAWAFEEDSVLQSPEYQKSFSVFVAKLGLHELPRLDAYKGGYGYRIPEPGVWVSNGAVYANKMFLGLTLRYTTDGSEPAINSRVYTSPIKSKGTITLKLFNEKGRSGKKVAVVNN